MTAGQEFVKVIKPLGCAIFLIVLVLFLVLALTSGRGTVLDIGQYAPPAGLGADDPEGLCEELTRSVLPLLPGDNECYVNQGRLYVALDGAHFKDCRATILHYYPDRRIQFLRK